METKAVNLDDYSPMSESHELARDIASVVMSFVSLDDLQTPEVLDYEQYGDKYSANAGWPGDLGSFKYQNRTFQLMAVAYNFNYYAQGRMRDCMIGLEDYKVLKEVLEDHIARGDSHHHLHQAPHYKKQLQRLLKWFRKEYTKIDSKFLFQVLEEA
jgi:hypothetical protein